MESSSAACIAARKSCLGSFIACAVFPPRVFTCHPRRPPRAPHAVRTTPPGSVELRASRGPRGHRRARAHLGQLALGGLDRDLAGSRGLVRHSARLRVRVRPAPRHRRSRSVARPRAQRSWAAARGARRVRPPPWPPRGSSRACPRSPRACPTPPAARPRSVLPSPGRAATPAARPSRPTWCARRQCCPAGPSLDVGGHAPCTGHTRT